MCCVPLACSAIIASNTNLVVLSTNPFLLNFDMRRIVAKKSPTIPTDRLPSGVQDVCQASLLLSVLYNVRAAPGLSLDRFSVAYRYVSRKNFHCWLDSFEDPSRGSRHMVRSYPDIQKNSNKLSSVYPCTGQAIQARRGEERCLYSSESRICESAKMTYIQMHGKLRSEIPNGTSFYV